MNATQTPENPTVARALAVLRAGLGIVETTPPKLPETLHAAMQHANSIARAELKAKQAAPVKKPVKAAPPTRDIWFYLSKGSAKA
ncbi:MAG: hypothetical protein B7Y56_03475 [Gallionellales bacterium 35-53-114]|jgi:hypothetical protein|nr:MAG: hypothetical protein B7Y56_03475 [Gallionellales bacterium 35-53-114]OYZ65166.1 MAG: hypothetical protein B7Y04_00635 [Gallionellales bacterium 24-53-125]OZB08073.1 MAG: hypothetical protein B7X61_11085 [Gallionellales bacterium 39-52-133]HQS59978.1 hypothetical protein [Gallionellaceae bacterium]HQS76640.1 hypothetical protein [Gallionellaceae bacterium]